MVELQIWQESRSFNVLDARKNLLYTAEVDFLPNSRLVLRNGEGQEMGAIRPIIAKPSFSTLFLEGLLRYELSYPSGETDCLRGESLLEKKENGIRKALKSQLFPVLILDKKGWKAVRSLMGTSYQVFTQDGCPLAQIKQNTFPGSGLRHGYVYQYTLSYANLEDEVILLLIVLAIGRMTRLREQNGYAG